MNEILFNSRPSSLILDDHKKQMNQLIFKELNRHYKRTVPVNSAKSIKPNNQNLDSEINLAKINSRPTILVSKRQSVDFKHKESLKIGRNSVEPQNAKSETRISPEPHHYLAQTKSEFYRQAENLTENKNSKKLLKKFSGFFRFIDQTGQKDSMFMPRNLGKSLVLSKFEKALHEEYKKDRIKMKFSSIINGGRKKIWRPDCAKVLRKVEKVLGSIPVQKSL